MNLRMTAIVTVILSAVAARLALAGVPNVSPITAVALFSGAYLADRKLALMIPLLAMLLGDLVLGLHMTMIFVYASFALIVGLGVWLSQRLCGQLVIAASLIASLSFFIITNFGVWLLGGLYPMTAAGLLECYVVAIPFLQMTLMGDLLFTAVIFGLFMALEQWLPGLRRPASQAS